MSQNNKIEWADHCWHPWIGCAKISPACDNCHAEASMPARTLNVMWGPHAERHRTSNGYWTLPKHWNNQHEAFFARHGRRQRVVCAWLADWADKQVPEQWRIDLFDLVRELDDLDFFLLTRRVGQVRGLLPADWGDGWANIWIGASVANQKESDRDIPQLLDVPAAKRFLSMEPLLGSVDIARFLATGGIDWVIVGGESGQGARSMHTEWIRSLCNQCAAASVPLYFSQWGDRVDAGNGPGMDTACRLTQEWERGWLGSQGELRDGSEDVDVSAGSVNVIRVIKQADGRLLDNIQHEKNPA